MAKSQPEKAVKLYKKLANKDDPENQSKIQLVKDIIFHKNSLEVEAEKEMDSKKVSLFSLFSHGSEMTAVTIKICYLWFACCLTFVGLSLNSSKMNGNIYVNNLISATAQFASPPSAGTRPRQTCTQSACSALVEAWGTPSSSNPCLVCCTVGRKELQPGLGSRPGNPESHMSLSAIS